MYIPHRAILCEVTLSKPLILYEYIKHFQSKAYYTCKQMQCNLYWLGYHQISWLLAVKEVSGHGYKNNLNIATACTNTLCERLYVFVSAFQDTLTIHVVKWWHMCTLLLYTCIWACHSCYFSTFRVLYFLYFVAPLQNLRVVLTIYAHHSCTFCKHPVSD